MTNLSTPSSRHRSSTPDRPAVSPPTGPLRLLSGLGPAGDRVDLHRHLEQWGPLPLSDGAVLLDEIDRSGLRGRGGGWFPVGRKWRSVHRVGLRRPVVVANGSESEPASGKDRLLLGQVPHLVLDGAMVAARATGATEVIVHLPAPAREAMGRAIDERRRRGVDPFPVQMVTAPHRFVAGQESSVVNTINGQKQGIPSFVGLRPVRQRGVDGRPTLVQNVETLAQVSLIARFGSDWFRRLGTEQSPGTTLLTVTGRWAGPRIVETPLGPPLGEVLGLGPGAVRDIQGILLGGYGGGWVRTDEALSLPLTAEATRRSGSSIGAGVVVLLPNDVCPLVEVARVVRYLQSEGAGQCGPCVNGLGALATAMERLAGEPHALSGGLPGIAVLCQLVDGRGACAHPDGVARFVTTALRVFESHADLHLRRGRCAVVDRGILPLPSVRRGPIR